MAVVALNANNRFQFIGFPNEWGACQKAGPERLLEAPFPIYWVPQRVGSLEALCTLTVSRI